MLVRRVGVGSSVPDMTTAYHAPYQAHGDPPPCSRDVIDPYRLSDTNGTPSTTKFPDVRRQPDESICPSSCRNRASARTQSIRTAPTPRPMRRAASSCESPSLQLGRPRRECHLKFRKRRAGAANADRVACRKVRAT